MWGVPCMVFRHDFTITKRLFLHVCHQDAAGKYKRTLVAYIPKIFVNVKHGTILYPDGWRVAMFNRLLGEG